MKDIPEYEGIYAVTPDGRIWSYARTWTTYGNGKQSLPGHFMKTSIGKNGYVCVGLSRDKTYRTFSVHRLVAKVFIPNPDNLPWINHKDANKANNLVSNLEWCTPSYNIKHAHRMGLHPPRRHDELCRCFKCRPTYRKLSREQAMEILEQKNKTDATVLADRYKLCLTSIHNIWKGKTWKELSIETQ